MRHIMLYSIQLQTKTKFCIGILSFLFFVSLCCGGEYTGGSGRQDSLRGVWVATVSNRDYPSEPTRDPELLKQEAVAILDQADDIGFNAIFLQVRPAADAFYRSSLFPWSRHLTGRQGIAPSKGFDPLEFWVSEAHKRGMELHAWINPYRVTAGESGERLRLSDDNIALQRPELVKQCEGNLYLDPGNPFSKAYVASGVVEIVSNYDVDGIHFDDYFYPSRDFPDKRTFVKYGGEYDSRADWRRDNVTAMVRLVKQSIQGADTSVRFGISPFGIWANRKNNGFGSDTDGMESFYDHYADTRLWVKEGYLDYITPQIYWNIGFDVADYSVLVDWWRKVVEDTDVDLYVGHAAYKVDKPGQPRAWFEDREILRQLRCNERVGGVAGDIFFSYGSVVNNKTLKRQIKHFFSAKP